MTTELRAMEPDLQRESRNDDPFKPMGEPGNLYRALCESFSGLLAEAERQELLSLNHTAALIRQVLECPRTDALLSVMTRRPTGRSYARRAANAAVLACLVGKTAGLYRYSNLRAGLAAFLYYLGITRLPTGLLEKTQPLSEKEEESIRRTPLFTASLLRKHKAWEPVASILSQTYALTSGETDLSGDPDASIESRVAGICVEWDSLVNGMPHRLPVSSETALQKLLAEPERFSTPVIRALMDTVSIYSLNQYVILNSGEIARIVRTHPANLLRPTVRLLLAPDGSRSRPVRVVDLATDIHLHITQPVPRHEVLALMRDVKKGAGCGAS